MDDLNGIFRRKRMIMASPRSLLSLSMTLRKSETLYGPISCTPCTHAYVRSSSCRVTVFKDQAYFRLPPHSSKSQPFQSYGGTLTLFGCTIRSVSTTQALSSLPSQKSHPLAGLKISLSGRDDWGWKSAFRRWRTILFCPRMAI